EDVLDAAKNLAKAFYDERQGSAAEAAHRGAAALPASAPGTRNGADVHQILGGELTLMHDTAVVGSVEVYQAVRAAGGEPDVALLVQVGSATLPPNTLRASADRLAARALVSGRDEPTSE